MVVQDTSQEGACQYPGKVVQGVPHKDLQGMVYKNGVLVELTSGTPEVVTSPPMVPRQSDWYVRNKVTNMGVPFAVHWEGRRWTAGVDEARAPEVDDLMVGLQEWVIPWQQWDVATKQPGGCQVGESSTG